MKNNILDNTSLFVLVYRWRKKILLVSFVAGIIAACMTLFINDKYKSEVILFPTMNLSTGKALLNEYNDFLEIGEIILNKNTGNYYWWSYPSFPFVERWPQKISF